MDSFDFLLDNDDLDISKVQEFLEDGSSCVSISNDVGETLLIRALMSQNCTVGTVEMLLNYGADPHDVSVNDSALMFATRQRDGNILRVLLQRGGVISNDTYLQDVYRESLAEYLSYSDCSVDIVKLFFKQGLNVNYCETEGTETILVAALYHCQDKEIIRVLLEEGADPNMPDGSGNYPLCTALRYSQSVDIIKMLLSYGSYSNGCEKHGSVLHCATNEPKSGLNEDVLQLLLQDGADVRRVDKKGQTLLCFAIPRAKKACDIKLLLKAGALLFDCSKHPSPLICATDEKFYSGKLSEDKVKLLVEEGASVDVVNGDGLSPLELALRNCRYETGAIKLLFNLDIAVTKCARWKKTILHFALSNIDCQVSALELLINNGARLDQVNSSGDSLMHIAVSEKILFTSSIIRFLLELGTPVNAENASGKTPLMLAVEIRNKRFSILQMMLAAGARVNPTSLSKTTDSHKCFNLLLKYAFLQNPDFDISDLIQDKIGDEARSDFAKWLEFAAKFLSDEVRRMESKTLGDGDERSFREFLNELYLPRRITDKWYLAVKLGYFNRLLKILTTDEFPLFFDVICAKIGNKMMKVKMQESIYAVKCPDNVQVKLNYYSVCNIAKFLSDEDLLRLIIAFHIHDDDNK